MKIAFIVGIFPSLSETFILNQITGLMELGHEVDIFSVKKSNEKKRHGIINKFNLMDRVYFFPDIPKNKLLRIIKGKLLFLLNFYKDPKKLLKSINIFRRDKDFVSLKILYYIIPFLRKNYDIIHSHFGNNGEIGVYLRKGGFNGKLVTSFYGYDLSTFINNNGESVYKKLFSSGELFLPICSYFRDKLINLSCDPQKIRLHQIGIDLDKYKFLERTLEEGDIVNIVTAGRLIEKKGYIYSIKALKDLSFKKKNFLYTIIGEGPLSGMLIQLVDDLGLNRYVKFAGNVNQDELLEYYRRSHIFLLPSITAENGEEEGTPTVLLEAQAVGLPVVSTFHSGIPEIVIHKESGYLAEEKDIKGISKYLDVLIEDQELRKKMGKSGRSFIEKKYNIIKLNSKLAGFYKELLEEK
ncbi:MAG: glycosyltransferase [Candidatus Aminicenantes bacterium]|nr:glycosyltransferase [Candidatus Aminicenantes bacterium]